MIVWNEFSQFAFIELTGQLLFVSNMPKDNLVFCTNFHISRELFVCDGDCGSSAQSCDEAQHLLFMIG